MLMRASKVVGLPVFTVNDGKKIIRVEDVMYDPFQNRIEALLASKGGWFTESRVILFSDLLGIGEDAALINSTAMIKKVTEVSKNLEIIAKNDTYLTSTRIITEDGRELGRVNDIFFDTATGRVEEFEVSQGTLRNWKEGKKKVKITDIVSIGKDATIVRVNRSDFIQDEKSVNENKEDMHTKTQDDQLNPDASTSSVNLEPKEYITQPVDMTSDVDHDKRRYAVGQYLTKNILTINDKIFAREGDMVTYKLLQLAEEEGVLDEIYANIAPHVMPVAAS